MCSAGSGMWVRTRGLGCKTLLNDAASEYNRSLKACHPQSSSNHLHNSELAGWSGFLSLPQNKFLSLHHPCGTDRKNKTRSPQQLHCSTSQTSNTLMPSIVVNGKLFPTRKHAVKN